MKENYPNIRVGSRVTFGNQDDILRNIGVDLSNDYTENRLIDILSSKVPLGFNKHMDFMCGKSGTVKSVRVYPNPLRSHYLRENYKKNSIKIITIEFDDPTTNKLSRDFSLSSPMFRTPRGIFKQSHDDQFINKLGKSSSWGESQITKKGNADAI